MTRLVLIRHGETAWNAVRRLQGHIDIPLNAEGERQAAALGAALAGERIDAIVASDLGRARATAQAVARHHGLPVHEDARLRERCYGAFEGLDYDEIARRYPDDFAAWQARAVDAVMPAGERRAESFRAFFQRSTAALLDWAARHPGQTLAIVAHGGVLECAYRVAHDLPLGTPRTFPIRNASINRFRAADGKLVLTSWGEVDHLDPKALDELA